MGKPAPASIGTPSIASLREGSAEANAQIQGAPPPKPSAESDKAARALAYYGGAGGPAKPAQRFETPGVRAESEYEKGIRELRGSYDKDKDAIARGTEAERAKTEFIAAGASQLAQERQDDAAIQALEAANAQKHFEDYSAETQRQIDDIRTQKIRPPEILQGAGGVMAVLGGAVGGLYMGINRLSSNPFIDNLNRTIDREIATQEKNLATQKESIAERKGVLADMRATYKDAALARLQARNIYFEAAKEQLASDAATYDSQAIQSRADQAIAAISREQTKLDIDQAIKKAAAAQAAAAAAEHRRQVDFENRLKLQEMQNKTITANAQAAKDFRAGGEKAQEQSQTLAKELSDPKLVEARRTIDDIKSKVMRAQGPNGEAAYDNTTRIPGTGRSADTREDLFPGEKPGIAAGFIPGYGVAHSVGKLSPEERIGRQEWNRLFDAYRVAVTGAGASVEELDRLKASFQGANTPAEQQAAIRLADASLVDRESRIKAGVPNEVARAYDARVRQEQAARVGPVRREPVK
jgi:hypothetical protein